MRTLIVSSLVSVDGIHGDPQSWVGDFFDDEIRISSDLYEVLLAYQHFRRPSA